jgi:hypothetical protein
LREGPNLDRPTHVYFYRTADKEGGDLQDLKEVLRKLEQVSEVRFDPAGNVVAVSRKFTPCKAPDRSGVLDRGYGGPLEGRAIAVSPTLLVEERLWGPRVDAPPSRCHLRV